jgi:hypothetical protein
MRTFSVPIEIGTEALVLHSTRFFTRTGIHFAGKRLGRRTPTINHARAAFTENKRYPAKPRGIGDVVNRRAVSVYQTEAVLILIGGVPAPFRCFADEAVTKQYRVRRCSEKSPLRYSPAHLVSAPDFIKPRRSSSRRRQNPA